MHKKILSAGLAGLMAMSIAVPAASAYSTDIKYDGHLQEQRLDIDNDGTEDLTINDDVTFGIKVPATVNVDGEDGTAAIAGVIDTSVTLTAPESLEMKQDEVAANVLTALVNMGEDNTLTLDTSTQKISRVTAGVNSKWNNNKPVIGNWSGNFEYVINKTPQDEKNTDEEFQVQYEKAYVLVNPEGFYEESGGQTFYCIIPHEDGSVTRVVSNEETGEMVLINIGALISKEAIPLVLQNAGVSDDMYNTMLNFFTYEKGMPVYSECIMGIMVNDDSYLNDIDPSMYNNIVKLDNSINTQELIASVNS